MTENSSEQRRYVDRPPADLPERVLANCRPQPAIPAVMVFVLFVLLPLLSTGPQGGSAESGPWLTLAMAAGIIGSCALAVAAGFCSVFPQAVWFALSAWCLQLPGTSTAPGYVRVLLLLGLVVVTGMAAYQLWRIYTGRFSPTVREKI